MQKIEVSDFFGKHHLSLIESNIVEAQKVANSLIQALRAD
jgi:hypothetical protein